MKNLFMLTALSVVLFTACSNDENAALKKKNAALEEEIQMLKRGSDFKAKGALQLTPLPLQKLKDGISNLRKSSTIKIPSAWVFEENQFRLMLDHYNKDDTIAGVMAYPINVGDTLKIALVPYYIDKDTKEKKHFETDELLMAYDFSDIVPSRDNKIYHDVSNATGLFGFERKICEYKRQTGSCVIYPKP